MNKKIFAFALIALVALTVPSYAITLKIKNTNIGIGPFYNGGSLEVTGTANRGEDVIIKVSSDIEKETFMKKEHISHLFWMNKEKLSISGVSSVYLLYSSKQIDRLISGIDKDKYLIGYDAVKNNSVISTNGDPGEIFDEFIKYKEKNHLYAVSDDILALSNPQHYKLSAKLPFQMPNGRYRLDVYEVRDGKVTATASDYITISPIGAVRTVSDLAMNRGAIYGLLAIIIALIAGYIVSPVISLIRTIIMGTYTFLFRHFKKIETVGSELNKTTESVTEV